MNVLVVAGPGTGSVLPMVPLAQAVRRRGHEVFVAGPASAQPAVAAAGLAGVPVSSRSLTDCHEDRRGQTVPLPGAGHERDIAIGRAFGRFAADCLTGLLSFVELWPADVVLAAAEAYAAPLVADHLGVPCVRFTTGFAEPSVEALAAIAEMGPELEKLGHYDLPRPACTVSVTPPGLRADDAPPALPLRHIPYTTQRAVEPWAYVRGDRPRVLVDAVGDDTAGPGGGLPADVLGALVTRLAALDVELLVGLPEAGPAAPSVPDGVRCGPMPFDVLAPTCDAVVHFGAGLSALGSLAHGIPQLALPVTPRLEDHGARIAESGAGTMIPFAQAEPERVAAACAELLADASFRSAAVQVRDEMHAMPLPSAFAAQLERTGMRGEAAA
ncbi:glycosyltransferase [Streptomyces chrestomyceticus]|uniref:glycosyltransferase n=1 Tax=Streptomyces chrestomyceticus TaxID=68185 RepID=UPI0037B2BD56